MVILDGKKRCWFPELWGNCHIFRHILSVSPCWIPSVCCAPFVAAPQVHVNLTHQPAWADHVRLVVKSLGTSNTVFGQQNDVDMLNSLPIFQVECSGCLKDKPFRLPRASPDPNPQDQRMHLSLGEDLGQLSTIHLFAINCEYTYFDLNRYFLYKLSVSVCFRMHSEVGVAEENF